MLNRPGLFAAILGVQGVCAVVFVSDIVLSVLGLNLLGDGLRDLSDPKLARKR